MCTNEQTDWHGNTGTLHIPMKNDYLFRAIMQTNNHLLTELIAAVLYIDPATIRSVELLNPIALGSDIDDKTFILDILVRLNRNTNLNLEMQIVNERNWPERSLSYLCRTYDSLNRGEDYQEVKSAVQISLLDFPLFPEYPEFRASYALMNEKNYHIYSDKFRLYVVQFNQSELATEEDRLHHVDQWAQMFAARTWEELSMLAQQNPTIDEAVTTAFQITKEELIRQRCERRQEYFLHEAKQKEWMEKTQAELDKANANLEQVTAERDQAAAERDRANAKILALQRLLKEHGISADPSSSL